MRQRSPTQGHRDPVVRLALNRPQSVSSPGLIALSAILRNNVQRIGALSASAPTVFFDSAPFTLQPDVPTGSPTVLVTGSATTLDVELTQVTYQLWRDRGTPNAVLLTQQAIEPSGGEGTGLSDTTLQFLDTVDTLDATTGVPHPLTSLSTHTWSIVAVAAAGNLTGEEPALLILEQQIGGSSTTVPTPPAAPVNLGTAGQFASFGSAGISNVPTSSITGDLGTPSTASSITGFGLVLDGSGQFSTSPQVTGRVYAHDYAAPTPAKVTQANTDM
ncbi:MAG TPA: ice-binding family protein, partial [Polyangia bacterium]|nr:ice-binding family protein [Polyangia bacterium]